MLVLTRRVNESVIVGDGVKVTIVDVRADKVRLGIEADPSIRVDREEVHEARKKEAAA